MNIVLLTLTVLVFGKANAAVLGGWLEKPLARFGGRTRVVDWNYLTVCFIVCLFCAVLMTTGFFVIGIAHNQLVLLLGNLHPSISGHLWVLTSISRSTHMCSGPVISDVSTSCTQCHHQRCANPS